MTTPQSLNDDLYDLNLAYLMAARDICAAEDPIAARVRLGLRSEVSKRLARLSVAELKAIARAGVLCFEPRFPACFWSETPLQHLDAAAIHAGLLAVSERNGRGD